jgi:DNA-binding PadR family transcriptional regulator
MTNSARDPRSLLPLTPLAFQVLLALAGENRHGYAIIQDVEARTDGLIRLRTGTLYTLLQRLLDEGLIEPAGDAEPADPSGRRRYYRLTDLGRGVLEAEAARLEDLVFEARRRQVLRRPSRV